MHRVRAGAVVLCLLVGLVAASCGDDGPPRVLLAGDSVLNQTAGPLRQLFADSDVDVRNEAVNGSGLLTPGLFDWRHHLPRILDRYHPDVVVLLFIGNYRLGVAERYTTADGHQIEDRTDPVFFEAWEAVARRMTEQAQDDGAEVIWVLPPPMRPAEDQAVADGLRDVYEHIAEETGAQVVDANDALGGPDGGFRADLRVPDGVHLNGPGAEALAALLHDAITASLD
jgi:hypothetical protein